MLGSYFREDSDDVETGPIVATPEGEDQHWTASRVVAELLDAPNAPRQRVVRLWKRQEDISERPLAAELEPSEESRNARRCATFDAAASAAAADGRLAAVEQRELLEMVARLATEVGEWRTTYERRERIRVWLPQHRFEPDGGVDQRRLHHDDGHSPMHDAAKEGDEVMVRLLIEEGAFVNVRNNNDMSPLDLVEWLLHDLQGSAALRSEHRNRIDWLERSARTLRKYGARRFVFMPHEANPVRAGAPRAADPPASEAGMSDTSTAATFTEMPLSLTYANAHR